MIYAQLPKMQKINVVSSGRHSAKKTISHNNKNFENLNVYM